MSENPNIYFQGETTDIRLKDVSCVQRIEHDNRAGKPEECQIIVAGEKIKIYGNEVWVFLKQWKEYIK